MTTEQHTNEQTSSTGGPTTALEALKAFKEAQDRRVAHWKEYDEALEHYERTNLYADDDDQQQQRKQQADATPSQPSEATPTAHRCGSQARHASSHDHHTVALPMTDAVLSKILALVTSGLLDCSHSVRAVEVELRSTFQRDDLARMVGEVQEAENSVLRAIVQRDQNKRVAKLEGRDLTNSIDQSNRTVGELRQRIQETMSEINAEMAEM